MPIPKLVHFCWLSGQKHPQKVDYCIESWQRNLPDYEIAIWDQESFDIRSAPYVKQACEAQRWAFACDYIRLWALYHHGGIYLDADVYLHKSLDPFLEHRVFSSVEFHTRMFYDDVKRKEALIDMAGMGIEAAVIGAEVGHPFIKACLDHYENLNFTDTLDYMDTVMLPRIMTLIAVERFGYRFDPVYQELSEGIILYPPDVFSRPGPDSLIKYASHLCMHSWHPDNKTYQEPKK